MCVFGGGREGQGLQNKVNDGVLATSIATQLVLRTGALSCCGGMSLPKKCCD